jgi:hypothetical protein
MRLSLTGLHVLSREFTGVGSFTRFQCEDSSRDDKRQVSLGSLIAMPGVPGGMGAVLFCRGDRPECLETYTYGDERWDGTYDGFSIEEAG